VYGCPPDFRAPGSDGLCEDGSQPMSTMPDGGKKKRGGGLGETSATWPQDNSAFGRFVGSPLNADNLEFEKSVKGGKRRFTRKQCKKFSCKKMGFSQKASCRPYKNCYRKK